MISISNVSKSYEDFKAVKDVSFTVNKGSICGLLGPNGAGKTTLLKVISGVTHADAGSAKINGQDLFSNLDIKQDCFFTADVPYFFPGYTARQMAKFYKSIYKSWSDEHFESLANYFKISPDKKISQLSKGMQRQVAFWLAFSAKPKVLLLDEPMDGLDPVMWKMVRDLIIKEVASEYTTVFISSHNLRQLEDFCDSIVMMYEGNCISTKDIDDLSLSYQKVQIILPDDLEETFIKTFKPINMSKRGSIIYCTIKGDAEEVRSGLDKLNPTYAEIVPLTLEEVFMYEMEEQGYGI